jgi:uncharacterized ferritin-like protein (DUF455 family)
MRIEEMANADRALLISDIAARKYKASELAIYWQIPLDDLKAFVQEHRAMIEAEAERLNSPEQPDTVTPQQLEDLWITNKFERLKRLQKVAETTYNAITDGSQSTAELAIVVREFRSYLMLAANELGQLLHRGSGESGTGDSLSVEINGVDMGDLQ